MKIIYIPVRIIICIPSFATQFMGDLTEWCCPPSKSYALCHCQRWIRGPRQTLSKGSQNYTLKLLRSPPWHI